MDQEVKEGDADALPKRKKIKPEVDPRKKVILRPKDLIVLGYFTDEAAYLRGRKAPDFPAAIQLGKNSIGYWHEEVDVCMEARKQKKP